MKKSIYPTSFPLICNQILPVGKMAGKPTIKYSSVDFTFSMFLHWMMPGSAKDKKLSGSFGKAFMLFLITITLCLSSPVHSQNGMIGDGFGNNNWDDLDNFTESAGLSRILITHANGSGNRYFRLVTNWDGNNNQWGPRAPSDVEVWNGEAIPSNHIQQNVTDRSFFMDISSPSSYFIFKTREAGNPPGNPSFVVFEVQGAIRNVVEAFHPGPVIPGEEVVVTARLNNTFRPGQAAYLRYSNDDFASSTVVPMSGSGTTLTATIPASVNQAGVEVQYYVFTSGDALAIDHEDADFFTINLENNGGNNYRYTPATVRQTVNSGFWWEASTWQGGNIPQPGDHAIISNGHEVLLDDFARINSLTIEDGGTLTVIDEQILVIESQGTFTNHGTFNAGSGRVEFADEAATAGTSEIAFHDVGIVGTDVQFETDITFVSGTLHLFSGSVASAPVYLEGSVLRYATGTTIDRGNEWNNPWHVQVSDAQLSLNMVHSYPDDTSVLGSLTIDPMGRLYISGQHPEISFRILGNLMVAGCLQFHPHVNFPHEYISDMYVGGDYTNNGPCSTIRGRVIFNGSQPQNYQMTGSIAILTIEQGSTLIAHSNIVAAEIYVQSEATLDLESNIINSINLPGHHGGFNLEDGATFITSHPDGISFPGTVNFFVRNISVNTNYHFTGTTDQVSGNLLPHQHNHGGAKNIIIELASDDLEFRFNTGEDVVINQPGRLELRRGTLVIDQEVEQGADIIGTGDLVKSGGIYRDERVIHNMPRYVPSLSGDFHITGGTLAVAGATGQTPQTAQMIRGGNYFNLLITGQSINALNRNKEVLSSVVHVENSLEIEGNNVLKIQDNARLIGPADLIMDSGLLEYNTHGNIIPALEGDYFLTGGTLRLRNISFSDDLEFLLRPDRTYHNILVSAPFSSLSSLTVTLNGDITVNNSMVVYHGNVLWCQGESQISGPGSFLLSADATLRYESQFGITQWGNRGNVVTANRTFATGAQYEVSGANNMLTGDGLPEVIPHFRVLKEDNATVSLTRDLEITQNLTLESGILVTDGHELFISNNDYTGLWPLPGEEGWINGTLKRMVSEHAFAPYYVFPIGNETAPYIAEISFYEGVLETTGDATLTARFLEPPTGEEYYGNLPELIDGILINSLSAEGYWEIEPENITSSNYTIVLRQLAFDGISDPSAIRILKRENYQDDWVMAGRTFSWSFSPPLNRYVFIQRSVEGFSDFALGSNFSQNPLPVEWLAFDATPKDQKVLLTWQTATETNNSHFTVLHSTDGLNFRELGHKPGAGNSNQLLSYSFTDHHPEPGVNYYRLRQTDFDGTTDYSNMIAVDLTLSQEPNIFCHNQTIHFYLPRRQNNAWSYQIYRTDGGLVHSGKLPPSYDTHPYTWDASLYAGQILLVRLTNNQESFTRKIMVR